MLGSCPELEECFNAQVADNEVDEVGVCSVVDSCRHGWQSRQWGDGCGGGESKCRRGWRGVKHAGLCTLCNCFAPSRQTAHPPRGGGRRCTQLHTCILTVHGTWPATVASSYCVSKRHPSCLDWEPLLRVKNNREGELGVSTVDFPECQHCPAVCTACALTRHHDMGPIRRPKSLNSDGLSGLCHSCSVRHWTRFITSSISSSVIWIQTSEIFWRKLRRSFSAGSRRQ